jgi:hypothetical protein
MDKDGTAGTGSETLPPGTADELNEGAKKLHDCQRSSRLFFMRAPVGIMLQNRSICARDASLVAVSGS